MRILGFDYPDDCHFCLQRDLWVRALDAGGLRLGVTPFGVRISGHFFMCLPKAVGTRLAVGDTMAVVETNRWSPFAPPWRAWCVRSIHGWPPPPR